MKIARHDQNRSRPNIVYMLEDGSFTAFAGRINCSFNLRPAGSQPTATIIQAHLQREFPPRRPFSTKTLSTSCSFACLPLRERVEGCPLARWHFSSAPSRPALNKRIKSFLARLAELMAHHLARKRARTPEWSSTARYPDPSSPGIQLRVLHRFPVRSTIAKRHGPKLTGDSLDIHGIFRA